MEHKKIIILISIALTIVVITCTFGIIVLNNQGNDLTSSDISSLISSTPESSDSAESSSEVSSLPPSSAPVSSTYVNPDPDPDPSHPYYDAIMAAKGQNTQAHGYGFSSKYEQRIPDLAMSQHNSYNKYGLAAFGNEENTIYLTFDEGYEAGYTSKILDVLKEKNCTATFFVTMHYVQANPALVKRMIDEGHVVGNHTVNHLRMPTVNRTKFATEIMELHEYVKKNFGYEMHLYRPPTGAYSISNLVEAKALGYQTVEWAFAYEDWDTNKQPNKNSAFKLITEFTHDKMIYLLHAVSKTNTEILGDLIDHWRGEGYTVKAYPNQPPQ